LHVDYRGRHVAVNVSYRPWPKVLKAKLAFYTGRMVDIVEHYQVTYGISGLRALGIRAGDSGCLFSGLGVSEIPKVVLQALLPFRLSRRPGFAEGLARSKAVT